MTLVSDIAAQIKSYATVTRAGGPDQRICYYSGHMPPMLQGRTLTVETALSHATMTSCPLPNRDHNEIRRQMPADAFAFAFMVRDALRRSFFRSAEHLQQDGPIYLIGTFQEGEFHDGRDAVLTPLGVRMHLRPGDVVVNRELKQAYPPVALLPGAVTKVLHAKPNQPA